MFVVCSTTNLPSRLQHFVLPDAEGYGSSADHPNVNTLLNELRADTIPSPALGTEDINSLSWYIFVEHFGGGEVKAQQLARETELGFRRSLQTFASEIEEWRNEHLPVDVLPAARLLWYIRRSPSLTRALGSESAKLAGLLASLQDLDGAWRLPAGFRHAAQEDETAEATALCLVCLLRFVGSSRYSGQIEKAAVWLCNAQRRDGAWRTDGRISHEREADILTTATAREGLASSGLQEARGHVNRADAFLLRASTLSGGGYKDPGGLASSLR